MTSKPALAALAALALASPLRAADTPGVDPNVRRPSQDERMATARRAIDASDWGKAMAELTLVVREDPQNADAHNLLGYSWRKRTPNPDVTKAFEHYYTALRIDPKHKGAHEYIGQAYLMEKRAPQAEQHLAELEKICGGRDCPEYRELAKAISAFKAKN
jgi:Flp pilus assembly protein TadD